jgi:cytoskeletal protein CcmA (bactofilin family)
MKLKLVLVLLFIGRIGYSGTWQTMQLSYFDELRVSGNIKVKLVESDSIYLEVFDYCCTMSDLKLTQNGSELKLNNDKGLVTDDMYNVVLHYKIIRKLNIHAGATVKTDSILNTEYLSVNMSSGGELTGDINATQLDLSLSSGAKAVFAGEVKNSNLTVNTGAVLNMKKVLSEKAEIKANTGGQVQAMVNGSVDLSVSTGGRIDYFGDPKIIRRKSKLGGIICRKSYLE